MNSLRVLAKNITSSPAKRFSAKLFSTTVIDPPDDPMFVIPRPKSRENEPLKQRKARLIYQSRKRGMLENDLLLSTFVAKHLERFTPEQTELYDQLINGPSNDWEIYYWASELKPVPEEYNNEIMDLLKTHTKNLSREPRLRQPDLY